MFHKQWLSALRFCRRVEPCWSLKSLRFRSFVVLFVAHLISFSNLSLQMLSEFFCETVVFVHAWRRRGLNLSSEVFCWPSSVEVAVDKVFTLLGMCHLRCCWELFLLGQMPVSFLWGREAYEVRMECLNGCIATSVWPVVPDVLVHHT